jgi:hypothetical protein
MSATPLKEIEEKEELVAVLFPVRDPDQVQLNSLNQ